MSRLVAIIRYAQQRVMHIRRRGGTLLNVVDFHNHWRRTAIPRKNIRKIEDHYEYCLVKDYDSILKFDSAQAVQLGQIFANLVELEGRLIPVSILFPLDKFSLDEVISWLGEYAIHWDGSKADRGIIAGAAEIISGIKFLGNPLILYRKGRKRLEYDAEHFIEITEQYVHFNQLRSILNVKPVTGEKPQLKIFLNGEQVTEIPRIDFEQENLIISNGTFISADYMEDFFGCVAFFRAEDPGLPVAWIQDKDTTVYIELHENDEFGQVCILKFAYEIDLNEL